MLPDDVFRSRYQATITALRYWAPSVADAARLEEAETSDYWKIIVTPHVPSACPFALSLHADQRYDLSIAEETYESRPIETFDWFVPFASAVSEGNVVQRHWLSRLTGLERSVETIVTLPGGGIWREVRGLSASMPTLDDDGTELRERRFLPYRR
ncbi:MAG: hypothetical protein ABI457_10110 [Hyphomicrobium sp.]|jgi:hypothetical protein